MSILLAMELPTCKLAGWSHLADLDFVLAHKVLEDKAYADFFLNRPAARELILDNSYHELGHNISISDLLEAANRCRATYIITPDRVGDVMYNREQFLAAKSVLSPGYKLAVVMTGQNYTSWLTGLAEREQFLFQVREADMLCLTFKEPQRLEWYAASSMAHRWKRIHLLGCAELSELHAFAQMAKSTGREWSMDTGKALKHALRGNKLDELKSVRINTVTTEQGLPSTASQKLLELKPEELTDEVEALFKHNVEVLRRHL